jgi:hypothetical protein
MLDEAKLRELPPKAQEFWRAAQNFVKANQTEWQRIAPGTDEFGAWVRYFQSKEWEPFGLRQIRVGTIAGLTVPSQWPEWFDKEYADIRAAA